MIVVQAEIEIAPGRVPDFQRESLALRSRVRDEPGTIHYDWFATPSETVVRAIEVYQDAQAAVEHNRHCRAELQAVFSIAKINWIEVFGNVDGALREELQGLPRVTVFPPVDLGPS